MSSTVLIGYAHGEWLSLACVGDSRAYLIVGGEAEQLTVDGDVRCVHLAHGTPPEQVRDLGPDAMALFSCLGVGQPGPDGRLVRCPFRTRPQVTHWPMRFLDVVVLATDGLVEEGVFLDPDDLARMTREMQLDEQDLMPSQFEQLRTVDDLAAAFVWAACQHHRGPSRWEPAGSGDDVTCIVLRARRLPPGSMQTGSRH
jgi:serine/threonine protein phosphatase PrpC